MIQKSSLTVVDEDSDFRVKNREKGCISDYFGRSSSRVA
jgi:hypothetical protein